MKLERNLVWERDYCFFNDNYAEGYFSGVLTTSYIINKNDVGYEININRGVSFYI